MKKLFLCLLLVSPLTFAVGERTFNWTPPTEYDDASPLAQSEIASYDIECDGVFLVNVPNNPPTIADSYDAPPGTFAVGVHDCVAFTVSTEGVRSIASNTVNFTVVAGVPNPPILVVQ